MAWTLPDLLSAAEAKWGNGKLVSVDQLNAATESLRLANERIAALESDMREAAKKFEFEKAAQLRDKVRELKTKEFIFTGVEATSEPAT